jgi:hypothetical protein
MVITIHACAQAKGSAANDVALTPSTLHATLPSSFPCQTPPPHIVKQEKKNTCEMPGRVHRMTSKNHGAIVQDLS